MKKILVVFGIIIVSGITLFLVRQFNDRQDKGALMASGNVEVTETDIGFKFSGRITGLFAEEGERVNKGDRLALLDNTELESQVVQNRASLDESKARFGELKAGSRPQEIEQAKANLRSAEAELEKAQKDYDRAVALYQEDILPAQQMEVAKKGYDVAISQRQKAVEALSLIKEGSRKEEILGAENRVKQAEAALDISKERLNDSALYTPITGIVLRKNSETGEIVAPGIPVYTIGDLEKPWIKIYVREDKLGLLKLGQKTEVRVDSYPGKVYEGTVTTISSEAEFTPKNVQTQEERVKLVFGVKVGVKNINNELKPGMPADVRILLK